MARIFQCLTTLVLFAASLTAQAFDWKFYGDAQILGVVQWQDSSSPVYLKVSPDAYCYVPAIEKNMIALVLSPYVSGRRADIHCAEVADTFSGLPAYRLHRIIAK